MKDILETCTLIGVMLAAVIGGLAVWLVGIFLSVLPAVLLIAGVFYAWKWVFG